MAEKWHSKDPGDIRDYRIDWSEFVPVDDPIVSAAVVQIPEPLELVDDDLTGFLQTVRLSGGTLGETYETRYAVTTESGQVFPLIVFLKIAARILKGEGVR